MSFSFLDYNISVRHKKSVNVSPYINHSAVYILFWSFEISDNILRNQK